MPYDLDKDEKLDPMQVLEEAMRHFYRKAKIEESLGRFCDFRIVDKAIETAARIAREIVSFRHPRISAIKLAVADPNADLLRGDMTADEMREIIRRKLEEEGLLPPPVEHQELAREEFRQGAIQSRCDSDMPDGAPNPISPGSILARRMISRRFHRPRCSGSAATMPPVLALLARHTASPIAAPSADIAQWPTYDRVQGGSTHFAHSLQIESRVNVLQPGAGSEAGLGFKAYPHMLRHACGYALANKGHDTRALQAYLGHRNIQHTVRYTELTPTRFKDFWRE